MTDFLASFKTKKLKDESQLGISRRVQYDFDLFVEYY